MSLEAARWAYQQEIPSAGTKFVLVALADFADESGTCFPGQDRLAAMTGQSNTSVRRHLKWLESAGYIRRARRFNDRGYRTSDRYVLDLAKTPTSQSDHKADRPVGESTTGQTAPSLPVNLDVPTGQSGGVTVREPSGNRQRAKGAGKTPTPGDEIAKAVYDSTAGMVKYLAVRQIASKALKAGATAEQVTNAMLAIYSRGRPITLETVGQELNTGRPSRRPGGADPKPGSPEFEALPYPEQARITARRNQTWRTNL